MRSFLSSFFGRRAGGGENIVEWESLKTTAVRECDGGGRGDITLTLVVLKTPVALRLLFHVYTSTVILI